MNKFTSSLDQYRQALKRLKEALGAEYSDITRDSAIQRFEFTLDLCWKTVKAYLEENKGVVCVSPKECFREAHKQGLIEYDVDWLNLVDLRNQTTHTYDEIFSKEVFEKLPRAIELFEKLVEKLSS